MGAERAVIHLARASIRRRENSVRALGMALEQPERWLPAAAWTGVLVTEVIAHLLAQGAAVPDPDHPGFYLVGELTAESLAADTAIVGRDAELAVCEQSVQACLESEQPALITIIGQAGVGKSRLLREMVARVKSLAPALRVVLIAASRRADGQVGTADRELMARLDSLTSDRPMVTANSCSSCTVTAAGRALRLEPTSENAGRSLPGPTSNGAGQKMSWLAVQDHRPDRLTVAGWARADRRQRRTVLARTHK